MRRSVQGNRRIAVYGIGAILGLQAGHGLAQGGAGDVTVKWQAPAGCPAETFVHDRIRAVVGEDARPTAPVEAVIAVERGHDGVWRLTLATRQGTLAGRRAFEADSCVAVAEAAALVIAMMIDPEATLAPGDAPGDPKPAVVRLPAPTRAGVPAPPPRASEKRRDGQELPVRGAHIRLSPALMLDWGSLPGPTLGVGGIWGVGSRSFSIDFHGAWWPARRQALAEPSSSGVEVGLIEAGAQACVGLGQFVPELRGCLGGEIGSLSADAFGVGRRQAAHPFWGGLTAAAVVSVPVEGAVSTWLQAGAVVPLTRPALVVSPYGEAFRPGAIALRFATGLSYAF